MSHGSACARPLPSQDPATQCAVSIGTGTPINASSISRSSRLLSTPFHIPVSVVDLDFLKHDPDVEAFLDDGLSDDILSLPGSTASDSTISDGAPFQIPSLLSAKIPHFVNVVSTPQEFAIPEPLLAL